MLILLFVLPVLAGRRPLFPYRVGKGLSGSNEGENTFRLLWGSGCPLDNIAVIFLAFHFQTLRSDIFRECRYASFEPVSLTVYFFFVLMNLNTVLFLVEKPGVGTSELIKRNTASVSVKICINGCDAKLIKRNSASFGVKMDLEKEFMPVNVHQTVCSCLIYDVGANSISPQSSKILVVVSFSVLSLKEYRVVDAVHSCMSRLIMFTKGSQSKLLWTLADISRIGKEKRQRRLYSRLHAGVGQVLRGSTVEDDYLVAKAW
ncbi:hypothetical protein MUK42_32710 [Musa troglodytarum]|uniref:Uncharacterized protein n=1 Tax=Musa troglodytarum TaxID=320322 RepID=A0A9E7I6H9_9LILI|nr:hypothetical protein MUK42_32710 [Musa troglodytarum]